MVLGLLLNISNALLAIPNMFSWKNLLVKNRIDYWEHLIFCIANQFIPIFFIFCMGYIKHFSMNRCNTFSR